MILCEKYPNELAKTSHKNRDSEMSATWQHEKTSRSLPLKLDSYNSIKDFLLNTQTHLREMHIETSEGGNEQGNRMGKVQKQKP